MGLTRKRKTIIFGKDLSLAPEEIENTIEKGMKACMQFELEILPKEEK